MRVHIITKKQIIIGFFIFLIVVAAVAVFIGLSSAFIDTVASDNHNTAIKDL